MAHFEETVTGIRVQARIEALDSLRPEDRDLVSNLVLDGASVKEAYTLYVKMSSVFFGALSAADRAKLKMTPKNADCRGEVLLLLLSCKPCVLYAYGTWPGFAEKIAAGLVRPWLDAAPAAVRERHVVRAVAADCEPTRGVNFKGGAVLSDAKALRAREVDDAFFAAEPYSPALRMAAIGRALGYPSRYRAKRNSRVAFVVDGGGDEFRAVPADSEMAEFLVEGPAEVPRAARYFLRCADAAAPIVTLRLALCGRVLARDRVEALARGERVDETAARIARANRAVAVRE